MIFYVYFKILVYFLVRLAFRRPSFLVFRLFLSFFPLEKFLFKIAKLRFLTLAFYALKSRLCLWGRTELWLTQIPSFLAYLGCLCRFWLKICSSPFIIDCIEVETMGFSPLKILNLALWDLTTLELLLQGHDDAMFDLIETSLLTGCRVEPGWGSGRLKPSSGGLVLLSSFETLFHLKLLPFEWFKSTTLFLEELDLPFAVRWGLQMPDVHVRCPSCSVETIENLNWEKDPKS